MNFLTRIFRRDEPPNKDLESSNSIIERKVGHYLLHLPRCSRTVVVASPEYASSEYTCEITVQTEELLSWAEHHAKNVFSLNNEEQAARQALPIWLRCADLKDDSSTLVPSYMHKVLEPYALNFYMDGITTIFCCECQAVVPNIFIERIDEKRAGKSSWHTMICSCPKGHQIYCQKHDLHYL